MPVATLATPRRRCSAIASFRASTWQLRRPRARETPDDRGCSTRGSIDDKQLRARRRGRGSRPRAKRSRQPLRSADVRASPRSGDRRWRRASASAGARAPARSRRAILARAATCSVETVGPVPPRPPRDAHRSGSQSSLPERDRTRQCARTNHAFSATAPCSHARRPRRRACEKPAAPPRTRPCRPRAPACS